VVATLNPGAEVIIPGALLGDYPDIRAVRGRQTRGGGDAARGGFKMKPAVLEARSPRNEVADLQLARRTHGRCLYAPRAEGAHRPCW